jgi:hypothetical protein
LLRGNEVRGGKGYFSALIQDNLSDHKKSAFYELFPSERARAILGKLKFVFTPKHGSWLNIAEI